MTPCKFLRKSLVRWGEMSCHATVSKKKKLHEDGTCRGCIITKRSLAELGQFRDYVDSVEVKK